MLYLWIIYNNIQRSLRVLVVIKAASLSCLLTSLMQFVVTFSRCKRSSSLNSRSSRTLTHTENLKLRFFFFFMLQGKYTSLSIQVIH